MAFFKIHCDETGKTDPCHSVIVGGAIAEIPSWVDLEGRWQTVLKKYSITEFHFTDCKAGWEQFEGKPVQSRLDCVRELTDVFLGTDGILGLAVSIKKDTFAKYKNNYGKIVGTEYSMACHLMLNVLHKWGKEQQEKPTIALFFDEGTKIAKHVSLHFDRVRKYKNVLYDNVTFDTIAKTQAGKVPSQLADLIVGNLREGILCDDNPSYDNCWGVAACPADMKTRTYKSSDELVGLMAKFYPVYEQLDALHREKP